MNAYDEIKEYFEDEHRVAFGWIRYEPDYDKKTHIWLRFKNHSDFLTQIVDLQAINYDNGYGGQELFGLIVFTNGSWIERYEYDGSEWWEYKETPKRDDCKQLTEDFYY